MARQKFVVMMGSSFTWRGGMVSVVEAYRDAGLFRAWGVLYLASHQGPGWRNQLEAMGRALPRFLALLCRGRIALVHAHAASRGSFWRKSLFAALAFAFRTPVILHIHAGDFPAFYRDGGGALGRAWIRYVLRRASRVVVVASGWERAMKRIEPLARTVTIGNPVVLPPEPGPRRDSQTVLFMGRLFETKGVYDLIQAMPKVLERFPRARFVCAGDGGEAEVRAAAERLGVAHALVLPGWVEGEDKVRWLREAAVFALPSHYEALGVSALEAMAYGVPVIGTRVGGVPDLIQDGVTGLLVDPRRPDQLARGLCRLLGDEELRGVLQRRARRRVASRYSAEAVLAELDALYGALGALRIEPVPMPAALQKTES